MKHLISLSLKYIKRQKFRSTLTFLCITLSIFILGVFSAFFSSILTSLKNEEIKNYGSWEANLTPLLSACDSHENNGKFVSSLKAAEIAENHPAISDFYFRLNQHLNGSAFRNENNGNIIYFDVELDNGEICKVSNIHHNVYNGNDNLRGKDFEFKNKVTKFNNDNGIIVPETFKEYGYKQGDKISITITPVKAEIDTNCKAVTEGLEKIKAENARGETFFCINDGPELPEEQAGENSTDVGPLLIQLSKFGIELKDLEFINQKKGISYTYNFVIEDFYNINDSNYYENFNLSIQTPVTVNMDFNKIYEDNLEIIQNQIPYRYSELFIRTNDNIEFEDAILMYYKDLGFPEEEYYMYMIDSETHDTLLGLELKGANAITSLIPIICIALFLGFIAWAVARFVIDNAFEISVQERSAQFATLRIIGASKNQLIALIFTEATFYCLTALPMGIIIAALLCKSTITSVYNAGFTSFEFSMHPIITIVSVIICIIAIYTSAYTSALWASRKLSPAESINYGKPKKSNKARISFGGKIKSKRTKKSGSFIVKYTFKNIFRTKKRFLISTIAMLFGVLLFTYCSMIGLFTNNIINKNFHIDGCDFEIHNEKGSELDKTYECFKGNELFSSFRILLKTKYVPINDKDSETLKSFFEDEEIINTSFYAIDRTTYNKYAQKIIGLSYDEFVESNAVIATKSPYGKNPEWDKEDKPIRKYPDQYESYKQLGFNETPTINLKIDYLNSLSPEPEENEPFKVKILGTITFEHFFTGMIIPIDNLTKIVSHNEDKDFYFTTYLTVKDHTVYEEAVELTEKFSADSYVSMVFDLYYVFTGLRELIKAVVKTLLIFLIAIWLTGILSMVNSISTSVLNRQYELLMLRSVGMTKKQLFSTVIIESLLFSSVSTIIGIILGILSFVFTIVVILGESVHIINIPPIIITLIITLVLNIIIAVLAALPGVKILSKSLKQNNF